VLEVITGIQDMVNTGTPLEDIPPRVFDESRRKEELRQELIDLDVQIEELQVRRDQLEDEYYSMESESTYG
jgi:predicted nuclease with TOPRIM domain